MPYCVAYGCDNNTHDAPREVSIHRLPLKKPALLGDYCSVMECKIITSLGQWLAKLRLENPPVNDKNVRVCSRHFLPEDFIGSVLEGLGPLKKMLKPYAVPSVISYLSPLKRRKTSEARIALATHCSIIDELLSVGPSDAHDQNKPVSLTQKIWAYSVVGI